MINNISAEGKLDNFFSPIVQTIAIITLIYASFSTIIQQDTKRLIAYSSICHSGSKRKSDSLL